MDAGTSGVGNCRHAASARFSTSQALRQRPHRARCVSIAAHTLGLMSPSRCCEKSVTTSGHIESRGSSLRLPNIGASAWRTATLARCNRLASFARLRSGRFRWLWNVMVGEGPTQDALVRLAPAFDLIAVGTCRRHGPQRWWLDPWRRLSSANQLARCSTWPRRPACPTPEGSRGFVSQATLAPQSMRWVGCAARLSVDLDEHAAVSGANHDARASAPPWTLST
jgi:hypothetical protein